MPLLMSRSAAPRPRRRSALARFATAALVALGMIAATSSPASALTPTPVFPGALGTVPFNVSGTYTPLPLLCGPDLDIFWYAPGTAADFIWSGIDVSGPALTYSTRPTTVNGTYTPLVGDYDGDSCDDIFWYAPGGGADYIWYNNGGSTFTSKQVAVNGSYRPIVNFFNEDSTSDIYWYAPGSTPEALWVANSNRTVTSVRAPQVNGTYQPMPFRRNGVLWYGPGSAPDVITVFEVGNVVAPGNYPTAIDPTFRAVPFWLDPLLYAPGAAPDYLVADLELTDGWAELLVIPGSINGTYRTGTTPSGPIAVLHAPGSAVDQLMYDLPDAAAAADGPTDWTHLHQDRQSALEVLAAG